MTKSGQFSSMPSENVKIGYPVVCGFLRALTTHSKISAFVDIETRVVPKQHDTT